MNETINTNETIDTQTTDTTIDSQPTDATQMPQLPPQPPMHGQAPTFDATQMPTLDGTQPTFDATQMPQLPPPMLGQGFMPQADMNMWGNSEFLGEQMFNGENLTAPDDLGTITDTNTDISVNVGEQNGFGFGFGFPPAGMPPVMDGGQVIEQSTSTETQAE
ncbi:MAG: hypothetical protein IKN27_02885 [Selenomonadaceae bacterium]|nr:hypothetical protein [Selenomonadaceae bacterium]